MRILNTKIKDFRNIVRADINFGKINILTGKNSSGKSNFLLALSHSLNKDRDYSEHFSNNIVTYHPGKDNTVISATVGDINNDICYINEGNNFFCIDPKEFRFEKVIDKNGYSKTHKLYFTGRYYGNEEDPSIKWESFRKEGKKEKLYKQIENQLVYEESFNKEIQQSATKVVQVSKTDLPHQDEYLNFFSDLNKGVVSWIEKTAEIHAFVTEIGTREIYEQVTEILKPKKVDTGFTLSRTTFSKSKFIFLLADIQRNETQHEKFRGELKTYTGGIVTNISISTRGANKGEISIESPNGPRDIWTISQGTSTLLFFILLLNWIRLPVQEKSYRSPTAMIFDEIDSLVHPTLMPQFKEVLRLLSEYVQLFMSSHSPYFIDGFDKKELFLIKDTSSLPDGKKLLVNRCNIYDYEKIISLLPEEDIKIFSEMKNSELFVEGLIDSLFPHKEYE